MTERLILFDLDKTIFDTNASGKKYTEKLAEKCQVAEEEMGQLIESYRLSLESSTDFDPNELLEEIERRHGVKKESLNQVLFDKSNFILFPESEDVLKRMAKRFVLGVYSQGNKNWQKKKLELTGITDLFNPEQVIIERRKTNQRVIDKLPKGIMVVDDRKEVVGRLKQLRPDLRLVWINRYNKKGLNGVINITNLNELLENFF